MSGDMQSNEINFCGICSTAYKMQFQTYIFFLVYCVAKHMLFLPCKRAIENQQIRRCSNYYAGIAAISVDYFYSDSAKERVFVL